jgi:hypothetical protein
MQVPFLQFGSPHTLATPSPAQVAGAVQVPQSSMPPQPSPIVPQYREAPALQVNGTHPAPATHNPDVLHAWVASQPPQSFERPHPSPTFPQYLPVPTSQEFGMHAAP